MKILKFVFPVLFVVLIGYLYSCNIDSPINPNRKVSQVTDNIPNNNCPDLEGYDMNHMCLDFLNVHNDFVTSYVRNAEIWVSGKDNNNVEVYTCHYTVPGPSNGWGFGSFLPVGLTITRTAWVDLDGNPWSGTQTFVMPFTDTEEFEPSNYYMKLDTKR